MNSQIQRVFWNEGWNTGEIGSTAHDKMVTTSTFLKTNVCFCFVEDFNFSTEF